MRTLGRRLVVLRLGTLVAAAALALSATGCAAPAAHGSPTAGPSPSHQSLAQPSPAPTPKPAGRVLLGGLEDAGAAFIDNYLYVWQQVTPLGAPIHSELLRIDPITGQVLARTLLGGFGLAASDQLLIANGSLWVAAAGPAGAHVARGEVLRFQPETLKATGTTFLTNRGVGQDTAALAGGWIWVTDGGTLYKLSPADGQVAKTIPLGTADRSQVTTNNARGTVLIVTEAENGFGTIQTRNPTSGALIITTKPGILGVTAPNLSEVTGGGVWVAVATGMQGYLERLDVSTLRPTPLSLPYPGDATNGISAEIMAGVLYVQQIAGGPTRNYCGSPSTGQMFAALGLGPTATVLAANSTDLFYIPVVSYAGPVPRGEELVATPINAKCRA